MNKGIARKRDSRSTIFDFHVLCFCCLLQLGCGDGSCCRLTTVCHATMNPYLQRRDQ
ncbi:hypothetical protein M758_4G234600 [Ceratodon purpureus]|uniref:Secreted protein n=1 Tax=Ceratodon purpureus TaxID=3225 RepID=A0A8T0IE76_CERPU|nr:hypothetical protein KC19_4G230500 [Ceratodon purpureus]KAG0620673.1 hypothetical protein M758_4G234600 [Ceratodon purpureus]